MLDDTLFTQTALFAFEVALFQVGREFGIASGFVLGHSVGELAAAHVAGVFSLEDACVRLALRARLMGGLPAGGAMVAVQASEEEALGSLVGIEERVALAAVNGPSRSSSLVTRKRCWTGWAWEERGRKVNVAVSHAFHSPRMDGMLEEFAESIGGVSFAEPRIPIISNLTGEAVSAGALRAGVLGAPRA